MTAAALLDHDEVVNFVRPGLGNVLKVFLEILDEVDIQDLVDSLRKIVEVFKDEVAPYAKSLCIKLSDAFIKCIKNKDDEDDIEVEESLSAEGLIKAIRRVLESIYILADFQPQLYSELEVIL